MLKLPRKLLIVVKSLDFQMDADYNQQETGQKDQGAALRRKLSGLPLKNTRNQKES